MSYYEELPDTRPLTVAEQDRQVEARGWMFVLPVGLISICSVFVWAWTR